MTQLVKVLTAKRGEQFDLQDSHVEGEDKLLQVVP